MRGKMKHSMTNASKDAALWSPWSCMLCIDFENDAIWLYLLILSHLLIQKKRKKGIENSLPKRSETISKTDFIIIIIIICFREYFLN